MMDASTSLSVLSDDLSDYDVISEAGHASADSSIADFDHIPAQVPTEPAIPQAARENFYTASLSPENIQAYVRKALGVNAVGGVATNGHTTQSKTMRVYVDGIFDVFSVGFVSVSVGEGVDSRRSSDMLCSFDRLNCRFRPFI
jgi:hypothetical protein